MSNFFNLQRDRTLAIAIIILKNTIAVTYQVRANTMKFNNLFLAVAILGLVAVGLGVAYSSAAAPLPDGFPAPTPDGKIEVKQYPAYRAATFGYQGELSQAANRSFSPLFNHISSNDISMTAPVETRYLTSTTGELNQQGTARVSFLYRNTDTYPDEIAANIEIEDIAPMTVVSLGLQGSYTYQSYLDSLQKLQEWLDRHPEYRALGSPRRFFYDGPYIPDNFKRSEIQIPIELTE